MSQKNSSIKKVVITVGSYYPKTNGVQAVTGYLAEGLVQKGVNVTVVTMEVEGAPQKEIHNGVNIIRYAVYTKHAIHKGDIRGYQDLIKGLTQDADALITVCPQIVTTDAILPILDQIRCKKILYMHGMHTFKLNKLELESLSSVLHKAWNSIRWGWLYFVHKKWFKNFDRIIQIHRFDGTYDFVLKHYGIKSDVIENAADDAFFVLPEQQSVDSLDVDNKYILNVSNFIPRKNQRCTLEAYYRSNTDYSLVLIGSSKTDYYYSLVNLNNQLQEKYGKKKVYLITGMPRSHIAIYVRNATLYIMNSTWEVFPISLIEAMAAGVPFITSNVGIARFLPGGVIANTIEETEYWINMLVENEETRNKIGETGRAYATENLTIEKKVNQLIKIISE